MIKYIYYISFYFYHFRHLQIFLYFFFIYINDLNSFFVPNFDVPIELPVEFKQNLPPYFYTYTFIIIATSSIQR